MVCWRYRRCSRCIRMVEGVDSVPELVVFVVRVPEQTLYNCRYLMFRHNRARVRVHRVRKMSWRRVLCRRLLAQRLRVFLYTFEEIKHMFWIWVCIRFDSYLPRRSLASLYDGRDGRRQGCERG
jgi:hypothetical protein